MVDSGAADYFAALAEHAYRAMEVSLAPLSRRLRLTGIPTTILANDPTMLAAISDALPEFPYVGHGDELTIVAIACDVAGVALPAPPSRGAPVALRGEMPDVDGGRHRFAFFPHSRTLMAADAEDGVAYVISESRTGFSGFDRASPIRGPLSWLLPRRGRVMVHAGCVAHEGLGALLIGRGGAGKSTLATMALHEGWGYLGDDLVAISSSGQPRAFAVYSTAKTLETTPYPLSDVTYVPEWQEWGGKRIHRVDREFASALVPSAPLSAVVLVDRQSGPPALTPLSPAAAAAVVSTTTHSFLPGAGAEVLNAIARVVRDTPCWRINPGQDPRDAVRLLEGSIASRSQNRIRAQ